MPGSVCDWISAAVVGPAAAGREVAWEADGLAGVGCCEPAPVVGPTDTTTAPSGKTMPVRRSLPEPEAPEPAAAGLAA